jgi:hypothetical protein
VLLTGIITGADGVLLKDAGGVLLTGLG